MAPSCYLTCISFITSYQDTKSDASLGNFSRLDVGTYGAQQAKKVVARVLRPVSSVPTIFQSSQSTQLLFPSQAQPSFPENTLYSLLHFSMSLFKFSLIQTPCLSCLALEHSEWSPSPFWTAPIQIMLISWNTPQIIGFLVGVHACVCLMDICFGSLMR